MGAAWPSRRPPARQDVERERAWLAEIREHLEQPGEYLADEEDGETTVVALTHEWTRVGRSLAADVRFDDPTVSRRHALLVRQTDGVRVLDDRSLNGVFVNGERIEWRMLADGDEIVVGRYRAALPHDPRGGRERLQRGSARGGALHVRDRLTSTYGAVLQPVRTPLTTAAGRLL